MNRFLSRERLEKYVPENNVLCAQLSNVDLFSIIDHLSDLLVLSLSDFEFALLPGWQETCEISKIGK